MKQEAVRRYLQNHGLDPFGHGDSSVGMEHELQVAVEGRVKDVDLPQTILESRFYKNKVLRTQRGDTSSESLAGLHNFLFENDENIWENSWVSLSADHLQEETKEVIDVDF